MFLILLGVVKQGWGGKNKLFWS